MTPAPGGRLLRFVGDRVRFALAGDDGAAPGAGWRVLLRTNLGRAREMRREIIDSLGAKPFAGASWRDIPLRRHGGAWELELPLCEVGYFRAKAYAVDPQGKQHWPGGADVGISVHPDCYRTANTIYCAFTRLFGECRGARTTANPILADQLKALDRNGYTVIPPSGKLRDLIPVLPHIIGTLGCRILHLLPINPTPTTMARFGRFGSPYAVEDLTAIDPALVVFDRATTGVDQFRELAYATHLSGGRIVLDMVINHTGWGSTLQENHPAWFKRASDGRFASPGAWGNTWEDLVELDHGQVELWRKLAEAFLTWCRRGVDGFRCDAGYQVPLPAWRYITARVREEFPDALFLLEGLGGSWNLTSQLLSEGGLQWAYSELFQNYTAAEIATYLEHGNVESARVGTLIHYSETHDNDRLAKGGPDWSLLRNRLCALTSTSGGFGFTCGVEWMAPEKIDVHAGTGLNWDNDENLIQELAQLTRLLADHPAFFDGAVLQRLSAEGSPVYALSRRSAEGEDRVLVLVNPDLSHRHPFAIDAAAFAALGRPAHELLGQDAPAHKRLADGSVVFDLPACSCYCLSDSVSPRGICGDDYRRARAQAAWAYQALSRVMPIEDIGAGDWRQVSKLVDEAPIRFLGALCRIDAAKANTDLLAALAAAADVDDLPRVVPWSQRDLNRITLVPSGHWLLIRDQAPFHASLASAAGGTPATVTSIAVREGHVAWFPPQADHGDAELTIDSFAAQGLLARGRLRFLAERPDLRPSRPEDGLALLTNGSGAMCRMRVDLGRIDSKYDCLLAANLHPSVPVDRHVFAKRMRAWVIADGFTTPLDRYNLVEFSAGPPARWTFLASAGDGRTVEIGLTAAMHPGRNAVALAFNRPTAAQRGKPLPGNCEVRIVVRVDIEDRSYHAETRRNAASEAHLSLNSRELADRPGFAFTPASDRQLRVWSDAGGYHHEGEWAEGIAHPIEESRGMAGSGDAFSPGWFDLPLARGATVNLTACADGDDPPGAAGMFSAWTRTIDDDVKRAGLDHDDHFGHQLALAIDAYVVDRGEGKTVIAGYPWFLDWGRDTLIAARGLLAAGRIDEVTQMLGIFGRFESQGTLPNCLNGEDASNRETSDAPLWYGVVCEEAAQIAGQDFYRHAVAGGGRTLLDVIVGIGEGYRRGTPNGVRMDAATGLIWSPRHFTWMDTNHPAGTPREGYPVEIQALWIRLLRQLHRLDAPSEGEPWGELAQRAQRSLLGQFWLEDRGYLADLLLAPSGVSATAAVTDNALRSNQLLAVSLGLIEGTAARRCVAAATRYLVVPGALRSLAPMPVAPALEIRAADGRLLNNPLEPYWGRYEGDEDTRRKPAYHNGTAWTWTFPSFCEALARAWNFSPDAVATARGYLGSMDRLLAEGCLGHLPEITDGDSPHQQRGCDAQAWGTTEALRVWKLLAAAKG